MRNEVRTCRVILHKCLTFKFGANDCIVTYFDLYSVDTNLIHRNKVKLSMIMLQPLASCHGDILSGSIWVACALTPGITCKQNTQKVTSVKMSVRIRLLHT